MQILLLLCLALGARYPQPLPLSRCRGCSAEHFFELLVRANADRLDEVIRRLQHDLVSDELYAHLMGALGTSANPYAELFERHIPSASRMDYFVYASVMHVLTEGMVMLISQPTGTALGYSLTVKELGDSDLTNYLYQFVRDAAIVADANSFKGLMIPGVPGFLAAYSVEARHIATYLHDALSGVPDAFTDSLALAEYIEKSALALGNGSILPTEALFKYVSEAPREYPGPYLTGTRFTYPFSLMFASTGPGSYDGEVVFSNGTVLRRLNPLHGVWRIVQTDGLFNTTNPKRSDFRITQLETALDAALNPTSSSNDLYNVMRTYPFRTETTPLLALFTEDEVLADAQLCISIKDAARKPVACSDMPPPTNWFCVLLSLVLAGGVIALWVIGVISARRLERYERLRKENPEQELPPPDFLCCNRKTIKNCLRPRGRSE
ncbi:hypothetical protein GMRT_10170 [Giardia muris]|uniref:Uncharacterized protein n=1 Tax=Giardia muris TaxID=5742 RepID=A0A4Z1T2W5_GIAMU|nr:hypothetical protein GMRT_10170 [Giardia muris]|eukprot:TNJ26761.1 hypothetical protein GMRT_10170 [Giardia muris]